MLQFSSVLESRYKDIYKGKTFINNEACQYLKKFTRLIHLNLDETPIQGDLLVDAFKTISRDSILDCPLKFLSLEKYENRINISHLKLIGTCLPKLQYLNLGKYHIIEPS